MTENNFEVIITKTFNKLTWSSKKNFRTNLSYLKPVMKQPRALGDVCLFKGNAKIGEK